MSAADQFPGCNRSRRTIVQKDLRIAAMRVIRPESNHRNHLRQRIESFASRIVRAEIVLDEKPVKPRQPPEKSISAKILQREKLCLRPVSTADRFNAGCIRTGEIGILPSIARIVKKHTDPTALRRIAPAAPARAAQGDVMIRPNHGKRLLPKFRVDVCGVVQHTADCTQRNARLLRNVSNGERFFHTANPVFHEVIIMKLEGKSKIKRIFR